MGQKFKLKVLGEEFEVTPRSAGRCRVATEGTRRC